MIRWFLSLFRAYRDIAESERDLRARLNEANSLREAAEVERNSWREQAMWMRDAMMESAKEARTATQTVANIEYQRHYGWVPYPHSPALPEKWYEEQQGQNPIARPAPLLPFQQRHAAMDEFRARAAREYEAATRRMQVVENDSESA